MNRKPEYRVSEFHNSLLNYFSLDSEHSYFQSFHESYCAVVGAYSVGIVYVPVCYSVHVV